MLCVKKAVKGKVFSVTEKLLFKFHLNNKGARGRFSETGIVGQFPEQGGGSTSVDLNPDISARSHTFTRKDHHLVAGGPAHPLMV